MFTPSRALTQICNLDQVATIHTEACIISPDDLGEIFAYIETADCTPEYLFIHPKRVRELVRKVKSKKEMTLAGHLWNIPIYISSKIDKNSVYVIGTPNYAGQPEIARIMFRSNSWWNDFKKKIRAWLGKE